MKKAYVFSGLGVDKRVFDNMDFGDLQVEFVDWITPEKTESLQQYALRLSGCIDTENPVLIGLSFGGMIAAEISKTMRCRKTILIASATNARELPALYRFLGVLNIHRFIPAFVLKKRTVLTDWLFGITSDEDRCLLTAILKDTDPLFLRWALTAVLNWTTNSSPTQIFRIHGDKDRIIPLNLVKADYVVKGGGHFMTVNKADEISSVIRNICASLQ